MKDESVLHAALYVDTSAVLRAILERGTTPQIEARIRGSRLLVTSRLSLVESSRAFLRLRQLQRASEKALADSEREAGALWARCALWEITPAICEMARVVAPGKPLRTLDALHLATYVLARRRIGDLELLTADDRMRNAATAV